MLARVTDKLYDLATLEWLMGPVYEKELANGKWRYGMWTARPCYYILFFSRFAMPGFFGWVSAQGDTPFARAAHFRDEWQKAVVGGLFLQFIVVQLAAIALLADSFAAERRRRSLGVLLTTPLTSVQIVWGKLAGRLLHPLVIVASTLPVFTVTRVFAHVEWMSILGGICITLTATVLAGAVTQFFSLGSRHPHMPFFAGALTIGLLYGAAALVCPPASAASPTQSWRPYAVGPFGTMCQISLNGLNPAVWISPQWVLPCLMTLLGAFLVLSLTSFRMRAAALRSMFPRPRSHLSLGAVVRRVIRARSAARSRDEAVRALRGAPVVWRELRGLRFAEDLAWGLLALVVAGIPHAFRVSAGPWAPLCVSVLLPVVVASFRTVTLAAVSVTAEKEAGTWAVLLTAGLDDGQIVYGKALAAVQRSLPVWCAVFGWSLFVGLPMLTPGIATWSVWIASSSLIVATSLVFVMALGLYLGVRHNNTTQAVVGAVTWGVCAVGCWGFLTALNGLLFGKGFGLPPWAVVLITQTECILIQVPLAFVLLAEARQQLRRSIF